MAGCNLFFRNYRAAYAFISSPLQMEKGAKAGGIEGGPADDNFTEKTNARLSPLASLSSLSEWCEWTSRDVISKNLTVVTLTC